MPSVWIALLALTAAAAGQETAGSAQVPTSDSPPAARVRETSPEVAENRDEAGKPSAKLRKRKGRELLAAVRETLARLAHPKDDQLEASIEEILFVHQELRADDAMASSQRGYYTAKVESRLNQLSIQLKKRISRNERLAKRKPPQQIRVPENSGEQLAQRVVGAAPPVRPLVGGGAAPAGGRQPNDDYGQHLVDLIQKTIAPSTWDVNGGLGSIYYWRPGRALVVRQTGEVHDKMGDALGQLRRAGP